MLPRLIAAIRRSKWVDCARRTDGAVAVIFALLALPILFLIGIGVDYTFAAYREEKLNAIADAAALAAVTPMLMSQSDAISAAAASIVFNAEVTNVSGVAYQAQNLNVAVSDSGSSRFVTVSYTASSQNIFATLLGKPTIALSGSSQATNTSPPNIDFYLLLDSSPSMALAATSAGMQTLINNTQSQTDGSAKGCAFACHETNPAADNLNNPAITSVNPNYVCNGKEDNFTLARCLGLTLRIDLVQTAAANLMSAAQTKESQTNATYRMAIYTFDVAFNTIQALTSNLTTAANAAKSNINLLTVCNNNYLVCGTLNNDVDTDYDNAMTNINSVMPNPGQGTNAKGDSPQEVLFLVTDGVEDACETPTLNSYSGGGCREQWYMNQDYDWCTAIKNRGIRIAVLYTTYVPMVSPPLTSYNSGWYTNFDGAGAGIVSFISASQDQAATALQACASPNLFYEVQNDGNISAALSELFQIVVQTARLTK